MLPLLYGGSGELQSIGNTAQSAIMLDTIFHTGVRLTHTRSAEVWLEWADLHANV